MKTGRAARITVGVLTAVYVLLPLAFFAVWFTTFGPFLLAAGRGDPEPPFGVWQAFSFPLFFALICLFNFLYYGLIIYYLAHLVKNRSGSEVWRIVLAAGFLIFPMLALPIYYLLYILPEQPPAWALQRLPEAS